MIALISGVIAFVMVSPNGSLTVPAVAVSVTVAAVSMLAWFYSPLPSHNGGFGAPPARKQKWGFTTKPQDGQPDVDHRERFAYRPRAFGIYWASNQPSDDDEKAEHDKDQ